MMDKMLCKIMRQENVNVKLKNKKILDDISLINLKIKYKLCEKSET